MGQFPARGRGKSDFLRYFNMLSAITLSRSNCAAGAAAASHFTTLDVLRIAARALCITLLSDKVIHDHFVAAAEITLSRLRGVDQRSLCRAFL